MRFQRRFNFTGRKRLNKSDVQISLRPSPNGSMSFSAGINFSEMGLPADARVVIEARQHDLVQRFECGTVADFRVPADTCLTELDCDSPLSFGVRVVDATRTDRRLAAVARSIRPVGGDEDGAGRDSLLSLKCKDLGQLPWTIEYPESEDDIPRLVVNSRIPSSMDRLRSDPLWQALIFPAAVREILAHVLHDLDKNDEEGLDLWQSKWLEHGARLSGEHFLSAEYGDSASDWIDTCAREFSERFAVTDRILNLEQEGQL